MADKMYWPILSIMQMRPTLHQKRVPHDTSTQPPLRLPDEAGWSATNMQRCATGRPTSMQDLVTAYTNMP